MIEIKIEDHPDQQFSLILERRRVTMRLVYNQTTERWSFDLSIDDMPILHGRRIVTGVDLLAAFDLGVGVIFAAPIIEGAVPDRYQLANGSVKIFQTTEAEIEAAIIPLIEEPQTPNVLPIIWTAPPATYFGAAFLVGRLLDQIEEGIAVDFVNDEVLIRSNANPSLNFIGTFDAAVSQGKFEYVRASTAFRYDITGLLSSVGNDVLRIQHDPLTNLRLGALFEPATANLVANSAVTNDSSGTDAFTDALTAPNGTSSAELIYENTTNGNHSFGYEAFNLTNGQKYTWSFFVRKSDNPRNVILAAFDAGSGFFGATFDPSSGQWVNDFGILSKGVDKLSDDWYRVWVIFQATATGAGAAYGYFLNASGLDSYVGDGVSGAYIWGRDFRQVGRRVEHFPTSGVAAGPALDDFKIPLVSIPWHDGAGEFLINDVVREPTVSSDKIVFPSNISEPIRTFRYRII